MHAAEAITATPMRQAPVRADVIFYTVRDFCEPRALPRSTFYALVKDKRIRITKRGTRSLIHVDEAKRYDAALLAA